MPQYFRIAPLLYRLPGPVKERGGDARFSVYQPSRDVREADMLFWVSEELELAEAGVLAEAGRGAAGDR
jgi:hypothetical protein